VGHVGGWLAATPADIVLLHIGTNDIHGNNEDPDEVSDVLDEIYAADSNVTVVLALIINGWSSYNKRDLISTFNSNVNVMAQTRILNGEDLIVVDMENGAGINYSDQGPDMNDKLHPTQLGYDKMATNWFSGCGGSHPATDPCSGIH
jgi:lysophospholipase L1-like esterase